MICIHLDTEIFLFSKRGDNGVGMFLCLLMMVGNELACYFVNPAGSDDWHVGFASREYAVGPNGKRFAGMLVRLVAVYTPDFENWTA